MRLRRRIECAQSLRIVEGQRVVVVVDVVVIIVARGVVVVIVVDTVVVDVVVIVDSSVDDTRGTATVVIHTRIITVHVDIPVVVTVIELLGFHHRRQFESDGGVAGATGIRIRRQPIMVRRYLTRSQIFRGLTMIV